MMREHDPEEEQAKARLVRKSSTEDNDVTCYPVTQSVDDLKRIFPDALSTDECGRVYLHLDEWHDLRNNEAGRRLAEQMARAARTPTPGTDTPLGVSGIGKTRLPDLGMRIDPYVNPHEEFYRDSSDGSED